jgi:hypothetical protein
MHHPWWLGSPAEQMPFFIGVPGVISAGRGDYIPVGDMAFASWGRDTNTGYSIPTNTYRIWTDRLNTNDSLIQLFDDTLGTSTNFNLAAGGQSVPGPGFYVGGLDPSVSGVGTSRNLGGDIAEVIVYQGSLSDPDRLTVVNYLKQKYYQGSSTDLSFQWLFNGTNLAGATNSFLTLSNVQATQAGTYWVVVSNAYGIATSSNAFLGVNLIPIIVEEPTNQTVFLSRPATFSVLAEGPVPLQYQWTFNGTNISGATNSALVFSNAVPSEAGTYSVILGTEPNVTVSSNALLSLFPANEIVSNLDEGDLVTALTAGGTVTFATNGTIVLNSTITLSNSVILDGTNHSITISGGGAVELFNLPAGLNLTLRNLTLANGLVQGENSEGYPELAYGGAIYTQGNLNVMNCTFTNSSVTSDDYFYDGSPTYGGAIFNSGSLTISNTLFVNNSAVGGAGGGDQKQTGANGFGGAIYNNGGTLVLGNDVFSNNTATGGEVYANPYGNGSQAGSGYGGAIYCSNGVITANNIQVVGNAAMGGACFQGENYGNMGSQQAGSGYGGAIYCLNGVITANNMQVVENAAMGGTCVQQGATYSGPMSSGSAFGGALYLGGGTITISNGLFSNNSSSAPDADGGTPGQAQGGSVLNAGSVLFSACNFTGSLAQGATAEYGSGAGSAGSPGFGGAIYNTGFVLQTNTTFSNNSTTGPGSYGGQIYNSGLIQSANNCFMMSSVTGAPPLAYQWEMNGNNIAYATNSTFLLQNVFFDSAAIYTLVVSNGAGLVTSIDEILNQPAQPPPPLVITSIVPIAGLTNGGTSVTITGDGFLNGATVSFGNAAATSVSVVSSTSITAVTPPAATMGAVNVILTNGDFEQVVVSNGFTYEAQLFISAPQQSNETFTVNVGGAGMTGFSFVIESSTNLVNWQPLQTNSSPFTFSDTNAGSYPLRFYRAVLVP